MAPRRLTGTPVVMAIGASYMCAWANGLAGVGEARDSLVREGS
jgi:hypothetical protein